MVFKKSVVAVFMQYKQLIQQFTQWVNIPSLEYNFANLLKPILYGTSLELWYDMMINY